MMHPWRLPFLVLPLVFVVASSSTVACSGSVEAPPTGDGDEPGDGDGDGDQPGDGDGDGDDAGDGDGDDAGVTWDEILEGRAFVLESAEGYTVVSDTTPGVSFRSGEMSFSAGCNGHFSEISFEADVLVAESFGSTAIGCEPALHEQDMWFADFFSDRPTLTMVGDRITFKTDQATLIFIDDEVVNPPPPLVGTVWEIWALIDGEIATGGFDLVPTVTFEEDGTVHVFSGCNNGEGTYEVASDVIRFDDGIGYSEAGCPDDTAADVETHMQAIFTTGEITYSFNGEELVLDKGDLGVRAREEQ